MDDIDCSHICSEHETLIGEHNFNVRKLEKSTTNMGPSHIPGASPGLLRRRYSLPETVMRKYKLAQQKSESEDSEIGNAPSPRIPSPARDRGSRGRERGLKSVLLRRIWGKEPATTFGGSHSELRYWDSRSGSSSPRSPDRGCEACKRLSDKNLPGIVKMDGHSPPVYRSYASQVLMSPKRQRLKCMNSNNQSPERYVTQLENSYIKTEPHSKEMRQSISPTTLVTTGTSVSDRSSLKSITMSDNSSKIGLSSLVTSSYPVTDAISISELSSQPRSSVSYSSDDTSRFQNNPIMRPKTATDSIKSSPTHKKRRQSSCGYINSADSDQSEPKSESVPISSQQIIPDREYCSNNSDALSTILVESSCIGSSPYYTSIPDPSSETLTTSESQSNTIETNTIKETSEVTTSTTTEFSSNLDSDAKYSDTETLVLSSPRITLPSNEKLITNKVSENIRNSYSPDEIDFHTSKDSTTNSDSCSTELVTCIEKNMSEYTSIKPPIFECLEVVVSETLNSSVFKDKIKFQSKDSSNKSIDDINSNKTENCTKNGNVIDIDQCVSNILIDSLNTMTDQINEMNSNIDDDIKLNILEKEIKVKLQSVSASPLNIITHPIITTLITNIPDKELLETTIIEEKERSLAYTTESKLFPLESTVEIESRHYEVQESPLLDHALIRSTEKLYKENITKNENILSNPQRDQEILNNNVGIINNNLYRNNKGNFYLNNETASPFDINENEDIKTDQFKDYKTKAVLKQLHKMFENNMKSSLEQIDANFNICVDNQPKAYFCGTANDEISHLEMSTDVDVFVDNSLNKMMNSIDINYNDAELCESLGNITLDKLQGNLNTNSDSNNIPIPPLIIKDTSDDEKRNMISNIGTGSLYQKPPRHPVVVPRYSAVPHTESMEVNTSSDDEELSCQSDCMSFVDSLDDPNSPRPVVNERGCSKKISKYDRKLVRGDIMSLLPENSSTVQEHKSPQKEKSETFFVPIKENVIEPLTENITVAEHMPEKIREKLYKRQQKRELRKEYYKRKKMKQLKKEIERQKKCESNKTKNDTELNIDTSLINQIAEINKVDDKLKNEKTQKIASTITENKDKKIPKKSVINKSEKLKNSDSLKNMESFTIDKKGNYQSNKKTSDRKDNLLKEQPKATLKIDNSCLYVKNESNTIEPVESIKIIKTKMEPDDSPMTDTQQSGPRRLYQKTEFQEGDKRVEILEIVECVESSPEPPSDDSQDSSSPNRKHSKIPIYQKNSKNKSFSKPNKVSRTISKNAPINVTVNENYKSLNSKTDQLIANILIDAFNEDNLGNRNVHVVLSPRSRNCDNIKKPEQILSKRSIISQQKSPIHITSKYTTKFDAIPEEKSSISIESSNEDIVNSNNQGINNKSSLERDESNNKNNLVNNDTKIDINKKENNLNESKYQDVSTSPILQYTTTGTSPIIHSTEEKPSEKKHKEHTHIKGKKALGTKEGWVGFCRPQTRYSPDNEGSHPSSNIPSDREVVGKIKVRDSEDILADIETIAPPSQKILRTMDSKEIKQISIQHDTNKNTQKNNKDVKQPKTLPKKNGDHYKPSLKEREKPEKIHIKDSKYSPTTKHHKLDNNNTNSDSNHSVSNDKKNILNTKKNDSMTNCDKIVKLPSPFRNQSFTNSSDVTSSSSDSEAGINCPVLVPRWPPIIGPRRRNYTRRTQRHDDITRIPFQNLSGGWSVTLAGSCYTALPSDVEMKVCFPKNVPQQTTSQSDSGLGEEQNYKRHNNIIPVVCKKCGNSENFCKTCTTIQECKCNALKKNQHNGNENRENHPFLPPTQSRKSSINSKVEQGTINHADVTKKYYNYLPDLNSVHSKNRKKASIKMARRFSLHCWLPEHKPTERNKVAKMEISEAITSVNGEELSVFGCAIMPEMKPRVPTMSERDLTRVHTAQFYSRHRHM